MRGKTFIISGPSGVGKSTVLSALLEKRKNLYFSVSATTREPRPAVWDKGNSRPQKGRFRQQAEYIVWGSNGDMPISRPVPCLPGVFKYGNPQSRIHLTEKPLQLMRDIVKITEPGGHILDPFAGSGTTVLAAVQEGYTATGIEVTDTYAELARERIRKELACAA